MHLPAASADTIAMMAGALHRLIGHRQVVAGSAPVQPCECDTCVSIRAQATHCLNAETKPRILLRQWLSPEQLAQYEESASFEVVGSKTGKRYRIHHGRLQNVYELDGEGHPIRGCCFMPEGGLALTMGDVMLAQKIALETDEERAITVATPFWAAEAGFRGLRRLIAAIWGRL
jgi:hypothetical protein